MIRSPAKVPCDHGRYEPHDDCEGGRAQTVDDLNVVEFTDVLKSRRWSIGAPWERSYDIRELLKVAIWQQ